MAGPNSTTGTIGWTRVKKSRKSDSNIFGEALSISERRTDDSLLPLPGEEEGCPNSRPGRSGGRRRAGDLALEDAVARDDLATHPLHRAVHRLVRLEDPARLAHVLGRALGRVVMHLVEARRHAGVLELALDPER